MKPALLTLLAAVTAAATPQGRKDADTCPYCKHEPALMSAAGIVSHGPFPLAEGTTDDLVRTLPTSQWIFLETAHLRWASCLGDETISQRERVEAELARLRAVLPDVPVKPKRLDPWLRAHLYAMKGENFYARFQQVLRVTDADFPDQRRSDAPFMGAGKFLGEKDKFEVVLHQLRANHRKFTASFSGVLVNDSFRWHFRGSHKLLVSIPAEDSDLREDRWLWPHVAHNLSHAFLCAYKHFSYDPPVWLDEGLAVALEKEIEPRSQTREGEEGGYRDARGPSDFGAHAAKLAGSDRAATLAQLGQAKDYAELGTDGIVQVWSITRFLLDEHPEGYARLLGMVKGQLDDQGVPDGSDLPGLQRRALKEIFGWTTADLDRAWAEWADAQR